MTQEQAELLIATFRAEVEDLVSAVNRRFYLNDGSTYPDDGRVEVPGVPWASEAEVLATIPVGSRTDYLTVNIAGEEYWFVSGSLVKKFGTAVVENGSITLAKMANVASGTVFYRKTAGSGAPEVQTLATLRGDLNIPEAVDLSSYVQAVSGYSLIEDSLIQKISDLDTSAYALNDNIATVITIHLPAAATVAQRCAGAVEGTDYPEGWTISAGSYAKDLFVGHNLDRNVASVTVWATDIPPYPELHHTRQLLSSAAYTGLICASKNELLIEGLATTNVDLLIHIVFA